VAVNRFSCWHTCESTNQFSHLLKIANNAFLSLTTQIVVQNARIGANGMILWSTHNFKHISLFSQPLRCHKNSCFFKFSNSLLNIAFYVGYFNGDICRPSWIISHNFTHYSKTTFSSVSNFNDVMCINEGDALRCSNQTTFELYYFGRLYK